MEAKWTHFLPVFPYLFTQICYYVILCTTFLLALFCHNFEHFNIIFCYHVIILLFLFSCWLMHSSVLIHPPLSVTDRQKWVGCWKLLHISGKFDVMLWQFSCFSFVFVSVLVSGYSCFMCSLSCTFVYQSAKLCCWGSVVLLADQWWPRTLVKLHWLPRHRVAVMCHGSTKSLLSFNKVKNYTSDFTD